MNLFYASEIQSDKAYIRNEEARHCSKVLRMGRGDEIHLIDGKGGFYKGRLTGVSREECEIEIVGKRFEDQQWKGCLHVAIAPTKNIDRFEWFLEKATEIGINRITPIVCDHSERKKVRKDRLERILLSAVKQSLKAFVPGLDDLSSYKELLQSTHTEENKLIAHCSEGNKKELISIAGKHDSSLILIGPEGDFSGDEITMALEEGFVPVSLGKSRLRTETAGIVACQTFHNAMQLKE